MGSTALNITDLLYDDDDDDLGDDISLTNLDSIDEDEDDEDEDIVLFCYGSNNKDQLQERLQKEI